MGWKRSLDGWISEIRPCSVKGVQRGLVANVVSNRVGKDALYLDSL